MGRSEHPLQVTNTVAQFASQLRALRAVANLSNRESARRANCSAHALSGAAAGQRFPSLAVTLACVEACGGDPAEWEPRWHAAAEQQRATGAAGVFPMLDRSGEVPVFQVATEATIYISGDDGQEIRAAFLEVLAVAGLEVVTQDDPERGSWFQRLFVRQTDPTAMDKLSQLANKIERAAELKYIGAPRSENDEREAKAIACLAEAMQAQDEVVIRTSSVLFVKTGGLLAAWVLTEQEIRILNDNP